MKKAVRVLGLMAVGAAVVMSASVADAAAAQAAQAAPTAVPPTADTAQAPPAAEQTGPGRAEVTCGLAGTARFDPPVIPFPPRTTRVNLDGTEADCTGGGAEEVLSATLTSTLTARLSCTVGFGSGVDGTARIEWTFRDGHKETGTATVNVSGQALNNALVSGVVSDGPFAGRSLHGRIAVNIISGGAGCTIGLGVREAPYTGSFTLD